MRILLALLLTLSLSSCGMLGAASSLLGGGSKGPTVNAKAVKGQQ
jgi:hypothetical protein